MVTELTSTAPYARITFACPPTKQNGKEVQFPDTMTEMEAAIRAHTNENFATDTSLSRFPDNGIDSYNVWQEKPNIGITIVVPSSHEKMVATCLMAMSDSPHKILSVEPVTEAELHPLQARNCAVSISAMGVNLTLPDLQQVMSELAQQENSMAEFGAEDDEPVLPYADYEEVIDAITMNSQQQGAEFASVIILPAPYAELAQHAAAQWMAA